MYVLKMTVFLGVCVCARVRVCASVWLLGQMIEEVSNFKWLPVPAAFSCEPSNPIQLESRGFVR